MMYLTRQPDDHESGTAAWAVYYPSRQSLGCEEKKQGSAVAAAFQHESAVVVMNPLKVEQQQSQLSPLPRWHLHGR